MKELRCWAGRDQGHRGGSLRRIASIKSGGETLCYKTIIVGEINEVYCMETMSFTDENLLLMRREVVGNRNRAARGNLIRVSSFNCIFPCIFIHHQTSNPSHRHVQAILSPLRRSPLEETMEAIITSESPTAKTPSPRRQGRRCGERRSAAKWPCPYYESGAAMVH